MSRAADSEDIKIHRLRDRDRDKEGEKDTKKCDTPNKIGIQVTNNSSIRNLKLYVKIK